MNTSYFDLFCETFRTDLSCKSNKSVLGDDREHFTEQDDHPTMATRAVKRAPTRRVQAHGRARAGARQSIHAGRHLAATVAVKTGGLKLARKKLRHRALSSTLIYQDIDFEEERRLLEEARVV